MSRKANLIIVRAGDQSLHTGWIAAAEDRNFDLFISYYGSVLQRYQSDGQYYDATPGLKWPVIAHILGKQPLLAAAYDAFWFPDDDLLTSGQAVNAMFDIFHAYDLWLAQPALGPGSHIAHAITQMMPGKTLHYSDFVEVMCPIFNRQCLAALQATFPLSASGYGLDFVWPSLLGYPRRGIAVIDATPVIHTRAYGSGEAYQVFKQIGIDPDQECERITRAFGLLKHARPRVFSTLPPDPQEDAALPDTNSSRQATQPTLANTQE